MYNNLYKRVRNNFTLKIKPLAIIFTINILILNTYMLFYGNNLKKGGWNQLTYFFNAYTYNSNGEYLISGLKITFTIIMIGLIALDSLSYIQNKNINESQFYLYRCNKIEDYYKMQFVKIVKKLVLNLIIFLVTFAMAMGINKISILPVNIDGIIIILNIYLMVLFLLVLVYVILNIKNKYMFVVFFMIEFALEIFNKSLSKYVYTVDIKNGIIGTISLILLLGICYVLRNIRRNSLEF